MEYISSKNFIPKLKTKKYEIGSFDVFLDQTRTLISKNISNKDFLTSKNEELLLDKLPSAYRASIVSKENKKYIGYISAYDIAFEDDMASIILETDIKLSKLDLDEIITVYKDFLYDDLYIKNIKELHITNFDEVIIERKEFKNNHVSLNSVFFSPRC